MRRAVFPLVVVACALAVFLFVYRAVLFHGEQFGFRDAAHFYYPLYYRVQQEWQAGRWPLWDPWQNAGQPLLGNPMSAVLYPGKLVYGPVSYAWGTRLYVVGHTALAFAGMVALARSLGVSTVGAGISGLSYAFGGPVLFQYCNVIYLVGAAWLPWGLRAAERLVRLRRAGPLVELAIVLAMQVHGGDPQAAYLTVVCGAGWAVVVALGRSKETPPDPPFVRGGGCARGQVVQPELTSSSPPYEGGVGGGRRSGSGMSTTRASTVGLGLVAVWIVGVLTYARWHPSVPGWFGPVWVPALLLWTAAAIGLAKLWRRGSDRGLGRCLALLAAAALLGLALAAAPLFTGVEFLAAGNRTSERLPTNRSKFCIEPYRLAELVWPWPFGHPYPEHRSWIQLIPPEGDRDLWVPSLYIGGLALVLGVGAAGFRGGPPWRRWLTAVAATGLLAGFGKFASPLWLFRWFPLVASALGPHDPIANAPRPDAYVLDMVGSPYELLAALLPGFGLFRYPAKLFTLTSVAVSALAGLGWDELVAGRSKRFARGFLVGLVASGVALVLAMALWGPAVALLSDRSVTLVDSGPMDAARAWLGTLRALTHGLVVFAIGLALAVWGPRRADWAGIVALVALGADLAVAGSPMIWTVPQADFEIVPEIARRIAESERADPAPGPFRIHRMSAWHPQRFLEPSNPARMRELFRWYHQSMIPLTALTEDLAYARVEGVITLDDYFTFLNPQFRPANAEAARRLGIKPGQPICYFPRRGYDLWGVRYFILPVRTIGWKTEDRGFAAFLQKIDILYPARDEMDTPAKFARWTGREDVQLLRNKAAYPRAWLVHSARVLAPLADASARKELMQEILYQDDLFWSDAALRVSDPRTLAWIETEDRDGLRGYLSHAEVEPGESITVIRSEPQRVELKARLNRPGIVILADTFYPGWKLTIDGRPAPILRANRLMRGAAVSAGEHTLVYVYDPISLRIGVAITLLGIAALPAILSRSSRR